MFIGDFLHERAVVLILGPDSAWYRKTVSPAL